MSSPNVSMPLDRLDRAAVVYLTLPLAIFLGGWFKWWVGLPLIGCLLYALRPMLGRRPAAARWPLTRMQLTVALIAGCGWTMLGGSGHLVFANADWHIRDAVLHDLVSSPWPVGYGLLDGKESVLRAPVAFYLPAALVGKWLGLSAAHAAMGVWTAVGATLFLLQVLSLTPSRPLVALAVSSIVVLFSGLDIVGSLLNDGPRFRSDWNITSHLEWWAGKFQYSSMTTQLFWVPNHALGGWLLIGLMGRNTRGDSAAGSGDALNGCGRASEGNGIALDEMLLILVMALALWSPLTALGVMPFVLLRLFTGSIKHRSWAFLHPKMVAPALLVGLVTAAYLALDPDKIPRGVAVGGRDATPVLDLLQQAQFFLLEAGFIGAAIYVLRRSSEVALALILLAFLPLVQLGPANDLVMRASIPSLAVLAIGACLALVDPTAGGNLLRKKALLVALLAVGAVTPLEEIARAVLLPVWPINTEATLIGAACGQFAPHYVARLGEEEIGRLMRPAHRIALGPQGPAACDNPAYDLMWNFKPGPPRNYHLPQAARVAPGGSSR